VHKGLFGTINAFSCSIEEQGRSTFHDHILIWVAKVNKMREQTHHPVVQFSKQAKRFLAATVDKISCTECFLMEKLQKES
jgi:hypothetical protein